MSEEEDQFDHDYEPHTFEGDVEQLLAVVTRVLRKGLEGNHDALMEAAANVEGWSPEESPQLMGWVDDRGRP